MGYIFLDDKPTSGSTSLDTFYGEGSTSHAIHTRTQLENYIQTNGADKIVNNYLFVYEMIQKLFDADTIETHGLALDEATLELIEELEKTRGVIILTDPDYPGMRIRNMIMEKVPHVKQAFVDKKDAIGKKKLGIAEAREEAIIQALENVVSFSKESQSLTWEEFISLDIIGDKQKRLAIYDLFHLGYGNAKTLFKRLNMASITKQDILNKLKAYNLQ